MTSEDPPFPNLEEKLKQFENDLSDMNHGDSQEVQKHLQRIEARRKRNLVFDEERFQDTFLKCLVCQENYDEYLKLPKMLPCHHSFCLDCLLQMFRVEGEFRQSLTSVFRGMPLAVKIQCPSCRVAIIVSEEEIRHLPNDHTLLELFSFVKSTGVNDISYCSKHNLQPLHFFCEPCILPVCCDCTVLDHKESAGHKVMNMEAALTKYTPVLDKTIEELDEHKSKLEEKKSALDAGIDNLDHLMSDLGFQIHETFDKIREAVDERERELFHQSERDISRKKKGLAETLEKVSSRRDNFHSARVLLKKSRNNKDINMMFSSHQSAREALSSHFQMPAAVGEEYSASFQHDSHASDRIKSILSEFGNVLFKF